MRILGAVDADRGCIYANVNDRKDLDIEKRRSSTISAGKRRSRCIKTVQKCQVTHRKLFHSCYR